MSVTKRGLGLVALLIVGASPSPADPGATERFLANLVPNVDFLDRSSRFALTNSKDARLKKYAFDEARDQTLAANDLYDWSQASGLSAMSAIAGKAWQGHGSGADLDRTPTGSTPTSGAAQTPAYNEPVATDDRLPRGQEDLDSLEGLEGSDFDSEYKEKQKDALSQIQTDYSDYLAHGDDPRLLDLARRQLPQVKKQIEALRKL